MFEEERGRDLLVRGVAAAKANSKSEARFFFERLLRADPPIEYRIQAWRYLGQIADHPDEKRRYLEKVLAADPTDGLTRRDLSVLDGRLDPRAIVDPDHLVPQSPQPPREEEGRVLACRQCGSHRVVFVPGGQALVCEHCHHQEPLNQAGPVESDATVADHDFATTMWTIKGHRAPVATALFKCNGCGAAFVPAHGALSLTCPYCVSVHIADQPDTRDLILPDALIPFTVAQSEASRAIQNCQQGEGIQQPLVDPFGLYMPVWMFRFTGEMRWTGVQQESGDLEDSGPTRTSGSWAMTDRHALVCATRRLPETMQDRIDEFDLSRLLPYDARYLADWPAETYEITLEDASRIARRMTLAKIRTKAQADIEGVHDLDMSFARVGIDSFQLLLLPFWVGRLGHKNGGHLALVNGQTGSCSVDVPRHRFLGWIDRLLGRGD